MAEPRPVSVCSLTRSCKGRVGGAGGAGNLIDNRHLIGRLRNSFFHFEGQIFHQVAGLPIGCAVSGIVAILFMESVETRALALYLRYVMPDDSYATTTVMP